MGWLQQWPERHLHQQEFQPTPPIPANLALVLPKVLPPRTLGSYCVGHSLAKGWSKKHMAWSPVSGTYLGTVNRKNPKQGKQVQKTQLKLGSHQEWNAQVQLFKEKPVTNLLHLCCSFHEPPSYPSSSVRARRSWGGLGTATPFVPACTGTWQEGKLELPNGYHWTHWHWVKCTYTITWRNWYCRIWRAGRPGCGVDKKPLSNVKDTFFVSVWLFSPMLMLS